MAAKIDKTKCIGCGTCEEMCPNEVIALENGFAVVTKENDCEECGVCMTLCEQQAITVEP